MSDVVFLRRGYPGIWDSSDLSRNPLSNRWMYGTPHELLSRRCKTDVTCVRLNYVPGAVSLTEERHCPIVCKAKLGNRIPGLR